MARWLDHSPAFVARKKPRSKFEDDEEDEEGEGVFGRLNQTVSAPTTTVKRTYGKKYGRPGTVKKAGPLRSSAAGGFSFGGGGRTTFGGQSARLRGALSVSKSVPNDNSWDELMKNNETPEKSPKVAGGRRRWQQRVADINATVLSDSDTSFTDPSGGSGSRMSIDQQQPSDSGRLGFSTGGRRHVRVTTGGRTSRNKACRTICEASSDGDGEDDGMLDENSNGLGNRAASGGDDDDEEEEDDDDDDYVEKTARRRGRQATAENEDANMDDGARPQSYNTRQTTAKKRSRSELRGPPPARSSATVVTSAISSRGATNTPVRGGGRASRLRTSVRKAPDEDIRYLLDAVREDATSADAGFGRGFMLRLPLDWDRARKTRVSDWCQEVGFTSRRVRRTVYHHIPYKEIGALKRECSLALIDSAAKRAVPATEGGEGGGRWRRAASRPRHGSMGDGGSGEEDESADTGESFNAKLKRAEELSMIEEAANAPSPRLSDIVDNLGGLSLCGEDGFVGRNSSFEPTKQADEAAVGAVAAVRSNTPKLPPPRKAVSPKMAPGTTEMLPSFDFDVAVGASSSAWSSLAAANRHLSELEEGESVRASGKRKSRDGGFGRADDSDSDVDDDELHCRPARRRARSCSQQIDADVDYSPPNEPRSAATSPEFEFSTDIGPMFEVSGAGSSTGSGGFRIRQGRLSSSSSSRSLSASFATPASTLSAARNNDERLARSVSDSIITPARPKPVFRNRDGRSSLPGNQSDRSHGSGERFGSSLTGGDDGGGGGGGSSYVPGSACTGSACSASGPWVTGVMETPQPESRNRWGSRPIPGKDWGVSARASQAKIAKLLQRLNQQHLGHYDQDVSMRYAHSTTGVASSSGRPRLSADPNLSACFMDAIGGRRKSGFTEISGDVPLSGGAAGANAGCRAPSPLLAQMHQELSSMHEEAEEASCDQASMEMVDRQERRRKKAAAKHRRMSIAIANSNGGVGDSPSALDDDLPRRAGFRSRTMRMFSSLGAPLRVRRQTMFIHPAANNTSAIEEEADETEADGTEATGVATCGGDCSLSLIEDSSMCDVYESAHRAMASLSVGHLTDSLDMSSEQVATGATIFSSTPMLALSLEQGFLERRELMSKTIAVNRAWADASTAAFALLTSDFRCASMQTLTWPTLVRQFPWGQFLSAGTFKQVHKVWNAQTSRLEAVSVMDIQQIATIGNEAVISKEIYGAVLLSELVRRGICPNFVETFGMFRSNYPAPPSVWGSEDPRNRKPRGELPADGSAPKVPHQMPRCPHLRRGSRRRCRDSENGPAYLTQHQYIRMELCAAGDMEEYIRQQPNGLIPVHEIPALLFQIMASLYAGRLCYSMRHYDVKLLNFLMKPVEMHGSSTAVSMLYRFGTAGDYSCVMPAGRAFIVKLADYGTVDTNVSNLGQPIDLHHFTTLENTPIEQLIHGRAARQGYGCDTFALGLAILHLCTGAMPYEEIMEGVQCPPELRDLLSAVWEADGEGDYSVIREVILSDTDVRSSFDGECDEEMLDATLYHTLYRYLVLLGIPSAEERAADNPVWRAVSQALESDGTSQTDASGSRRSAKTRGKCAVSAKLQFHQDTASFSLQCGTHPLIARARSRLMTLTGAWDLLHSCLNFDATRRVTMHDAITSPVFSSMRLQDGCRPEPSMPCLEFGELAHRVDESL